jgi:hypothetical protein
VIPKDIEHLPHGDYHPETDHFNVAESSGAVHRGSLPEQWGYIQDEMKNYDDFEEGWKVLTLWMTANDVDGECDAPLEGTKYLEDWVNGTDALISEALGMKNVYINLISTLNLSNINRLQ